MATQLSPEAYDVNFCFPAPEILESRRVALLPFIATKAALEGFLRSVMCISRSVQLSSIWTMEEFEEVLVENRARKDPAWLLMAVIDKTKAAPSGKDIGYPGALAGCIAFLNTSTVNLATEIGCVIIFPPFQRTHVTSNAVGLLLNFALNTPDVQKGALGLRRVVWQANALNTASVRAAKRFGFQLEGVLRWDRVLPPGKELVGAGNGSGVREKDPKPGHHGRDTAILGLCWDDWENGSREKMDKVMNRES